MGKKKLLWILALGAVPMLILFDIVTASRLKVARTLATDAVTIATPLENSAVAVVRSDNSLLASPVASIEPLDYEKVKDMVWTAIELAPTKTGLLPSIIPEKSWVVVKPNMVFIKPQSDYSLGDITDPRVTQAVLEYLAEKTQAGRITLAMGGSWRGLDGQPDSRDTGPIMQDGVQVDGFTCTWEDDYPGFEGSFQDVLDELAAQYPEKVFDKKNFNYDVFPSIEEARKVAVPVVNGIGGWSVDEYYVSNMILNCDVFISVPAIKVHNIPGVSLAHKNYMGTASRVMYGASGWWLGDLHSQPGGPDAVFSDLFSYHPADYVILGGAWGMEGEGPHISQGGKPIRTNMVIAGQDPVAVDAVGATIMGFNPWDIEHLRRSAAKGYGTPDMNYITVNGDPIDKVAMGFEKPARQGTGVRFYYGRGNRVWLIHGVHEGADLERDFLGGEAEVRPFEGELVSGQTWTKVISPTDKIDLKNYFYERYDSYQTDVVSYAFSYVNSPVEQSGFLWVGAHDGVKIWLNGESVWTNPDSKGFRLVEDKVPVWLAAGTNYLLVKIKNEVGDYSFSLAVVDEDGDTLPGIYYYTDMEATTRVAEDADTGAKPRDFTLEQNYPNPFNSETVIRFALPEREEVELAVRNLAGQRVATLVEGMREAGPYTVRWDGRDEDGRALASGAYLYQLRAGSRVETRKLLLLR